MNKISKQFIIIGILLSISSGVYAQRHIKGMNYIDVGGGMTKNGFYLGGHFDHQFSSKLDGKLGLITEFGNIKKQNSSYSSYTLSVGSNLNIFNIKHVFYVNAGSGVCAKFDKINAFSDEINKTGINYGGFIDIENEYFISDNIAITLDANQSFYLGKTNSVLSESLGFFIGLGLKFKI